MTQASVLNENRKLSGQTRMSLPARQNTPTPTPDQNDDRTQSAPAVLENNGGTIPPLPTPDTIPKHLRDRFHYTPGLAAFLNRILHLSVISRSSPEELANEFFDKYSKALQNGEKYPALKSYSLMLNASFSS